MISRVFLCVLAASVVSACATYRSAPLAPADIAARYTARSLDATAAAAEVKRIAPSAMWAGPEWDRLSLFAAALNASPSIADARAHAASADAAAKAARANIPITLTLTAEYAGQAPESSPWLYGVTSDIPLDIGKRRVSRLQAADLAAVAARYDYAETVWAARIAIRRSLAEFMLTEREVQVGRALSEIRTRQVAALERRVAGGEAIRSDLERTRADAAGDARRAADAEARRLAANSALAAAIGLPPSALKAASLSWPGFDQPAAAKVDLPALRDPALLARADVLRAAATYDQSEAELRGEVAKQWPEIHIGPGYTWERGLVKIPFSYGLVLPSLDLNASAIAAAEARRAEAGVHLEAVIAQAQGAIDAAEIEREAAHAALQRVRSADLETARRVAAQADDEIAGGAIDRVDWAAAQVVFSLAQLAEIDALRRAHAADAALEDALRRPLEGPELLIAPQSQEVRR